MAGVKLPKSNKYDFNRSLVKRHKLAPLLDRHLGTETENFIFTYEPKKSDDGWHPSGACTPNATDLHKMVVSPEKKEWGTAMLKTFMVGHFWHQWLQNAVLELELAAPEAIEVRGVRGWGEKVEVGIDRHWVDFPEYNPEMWYKPHQWATGAGDIAPCTIPGHGDYVIDFKTMSGQQYRQASIPAWAADKYEAQINIYMSFFDLEQGIIMAVCKDSPHEFKEFEYRRNQPLIDMIYDKWEFVGACLEEDEVPCELDNEMFSLDGLFTGPVAQ